MSHLLRVASVAFAVVMLGFGCSTVPRTSTPSSPVAHVVPADPRALAYGSSIDEILGNPQIGDSIRAMFGADWNGGRLASPGAAGYFERGDPPRMVRIGGVDYIAVDGCIPNACDVGRVLLLIREGGSEILGRLDEGGLSHYYSYGNVTRGAAQQIADRGWRTLQPA